MKKNKRIALLSFLLLSSLAFFGWASYKKSFKPLAPEKKMVDIVYSPAKVDAGKLQLLRQLCAKMSLNQKVLFIEGTVNALNGADSTDRLINADYIFMKQGDQFYYKLGQSETINTKKLNLYVDNGTKKIMLSPGKLTSAINGVGDPAELLKKVEDEGYELSEKINGMITIMTLSNPYHLSCKVFSIAYETESLQPKKLVYRLSNFQEPQNSKLDNVLEISFSSVKTSSGNDPKEITKFLRKEGKVWTLTDQYKDYELINML